MITILKNMEQRDRVQEEVMLSREQGEELLLCRDLEEEDKDLEEEDKDLEEEQVLLQLKELEESVPKILLCLV